MLASQPEIQPPVRLLAAFASQHSALCTQAPRSEKVWPNPAAIEQAQVKDVSTGMMSAIPFSNVLR